MPVTTDHECSFQEGYNWYTYRNLEDDLLESSKHVAIDDLNDETWSEKLANLLILTGSAVDSFFRDMQDCPYINTDPYFTKVQKQIKKHRKKYRGKRDWTIDHFREAYEPIYELSKNRVKISSGLGLHEEITPFEDFDTSSIPDWWTQYNGLKHTYYSNLRNATLSNVLHALSGLLVLNSLHLCNQVYLSQNDLISPVKLGIRTEDRVRFLEDSFIGYIRSVPWSDGAYIKTKVFVLELRDQYSKNGRKSKSDSP
jgi:hypothetical protein